MNAIAGSPKTTLVGALMILGVLVHAATCYLNNQPVDVTTLFTGLSGGLGLLMAKDHSTHSTSEQIHGADEAAKRALLKEVNKSCSAP